MTYNVRVDERVHPQLGHPGILTWSRAQLPGIAVPGVVIRRLYTDVLAVKNMV